MQVVVLAGVRRNHGFLEAEEARRSRWFRRRATVDRSELLGDRENALIERGLAAIGDGAADVDPERQLASWDSIPST